jgi:hypothetical protein
VLSSSPQAVWPQLTETGAPPGPVPLQKQHPVFSNANPEALQEYALLSSPQAD